MDQKAEIGYGGEKQSYRAEGQANSNSRKRKRGNELCVRGFYQYRQKEKEKKKRKEKAVVCARKGGGGREWGRGLQTKR